MKTYIYSLPNKTERSRRATPQAQIMAAFNTVPVEEDPLVEKAATKKTPWRRFVASALVAGMLCAGAALNSKTAAAPTALLGGTAYDGSGVTWDCSAINSYVATSNGISSGTIESVGFSVTGNGQTLKNGKEATFNSIGSMQYKVLRPQKSMPSGGPQS